MPLTSAQARALFAALEERRWKWEGGFLYAPHRTMWLSREAPWAGDLADFIERMEGRRARIAQNGFAGNAEAVADVALLIEALGCVRATAS